MIHPSYYELIDKINKDQGTEESPIITSRYSIVLASSKRARQLTDGAQKKVEGMDDDKLLSVAVQELYTGAVNILPEAEEEESEDKSAAEETAAEETSEETPEN